MDQKVVTILESLLRGAKDYPQLREAAVQICRSHPAEALHGIVIRASRSGNAESNGALAVLKEWLRTKPSTESLAEFYSLSALCDPESPNLLRLASESLIHALQLSKNRANAFRAQTECLNADIAFERGHPYKALRAIRKTLRQLECIQKKDVFVKIRMANVHATIANSMMQMKRHKEAKIHARRALVLVPQSNYGFGTLHLKRSIFYKCCWVLATAESKEEFFSCVEKLKAVTSERFVVPEDVFRGDAQYLARIEQAIEKVCHYWTGRLHKKNQVIESENGWYRLSAVYKYAETLVAVGQSDEAQELIERILCDARDNERPGEKKAKFAEALLDYAEHCRNWGLHVRSGELARIVAGLGMKRNQALAIKVAQLKAKAWVFWGECMKESGNIKAAKSAGKRAMDWIRKTYRIDYEMDELLKRSEKLFNDKRLGKRLTSEIRKILPDTRLFVTVSPST